MNGARYSYLNCICKLVEQGKDIIIVSEDYAAPVFDNFRIKYPQHFLSVGIAEQNGVAIACGLALAGKYPIVYGCAPFPLTRALDQIKSATAGMHLPMTILNSGIGFGVPEFGATHYNIDDVAIVRGVPGMRIVTPTDNIMAEELARFSIESAEPLYIRFDKNSEGKLYRPEDIHFERGFHVIDSPENDANVAVISCGFMVQEMIALTKVGRNDGVFAKVIDLYSIPFDECAFLTEIGDLPIVTVEEHVVQGGIGSAVLETINIHHATNTVTRLGVDFKGSYPSVSGSREYFMQKYSLSAEKVAQAIRAVCCSPVNNTFSK